MKFPRIFRKKPASQPRRPGRTSPEEENGPKNGRLTVALVMSVAAMFLFGALNVRLIRDPSVTLKAFGWRAQARQDTGNGTGLCPAVPVQEKKTPAAPPELTFYTKLTVPENSPRPRPDPPEITETDPAQAKPGQSSTREVAPKKSPELPQSAATPGTSANRSPGRPGEQLNLPSFKGGNKRYAVQVGAFSSPAIAQQWALVWKERGYDVSLKPVARPHAGVIHRLYLGSFPSEKQADELVKRLNTREGISAFRVATDQ